MRGGAWPSASRSGPSSGIPARVFSSRSARSTCAFFQAIDLYLNQRLLEAGAFPRPRPCGGDAKHLFIQIQEMLSRIQAPHSGERLPEARLDLGSQQTGTVRDAQLGQLHLQPGRGDAVLTLAARLENMEVAERKLALSRAAQGRAAARGNFQARIGVQSRLQELAPGFDGALQSRKVIRVPG